MGTSIEETESAPAGTEPRWKTIGPPYRLTRDEIIAELAQRGVRVTDRQLKLWATRGLLPPPERRLPRGATDGKPRALHPYWVVGLIPDMLVRMRSGHTIENLVGYTRSQWEQWERQESALLAHPSVDFSQSEEYQAFEAMNQALYSLSRYLSQTKGERFVSGEIELINETGASTRIPVRVYQPGDKDDD